MIVYGTDKTELKSAIYPGKCVNCNTESSVQIHVFQKYAQVFWIVPLFPMSKVSYSQCAHCKQILDSTQFDTNYRLEYDALKSQIKTPIWTFSGLGVIVLLVAWITINDKQNTEEDRKLISAPRKGDVYEIKLASNEYTLIRVTQLVGDTVFFNTHEYQTNKASGLLDLKRKGEDGYSDEVISILKDELVTKLEKDEILDVERQ